MPRRRSPKPTDGQRRLRLERQLALVRWLCRQFGFADNAAMLEKCKDSEGRRDGQSNILSVLQGQDALQIPPADLERYDANIARHLDKMNARRSEPVALKYFQQLAALGTEYYLHRFFSAPHSLLADLNDFLGEHNRPSGHLEGFAHFTQDDLRKIAFWMATGSGKTLLLHLNYRQFLHYFPRAGRTLGAWEQLDNILLLTPNERLSEQHLAEFTLSGIPARRVEESTGLLPGADAVQVIEITKLARQKRGQGASIPLERFDGRNLVFVDEGHKGSGGDEWFKARERVGHGGFTLEYSATFGQAIFAAKDDSLIESYGKSILFDYSYKHFYKDGFGKDFRVQNLAKDPTGNRADMQMAGNLLSFHQQLCCFEEQGSALRPYRLERPLLLLLGSRVTGADSDVAQLVGFLHRFIRNERGRAVKWVEKLLNGQSGLQDGEGRDVFRGSFSYLEGRAAEAVYDDIMRRVFRARGGGALQVSPLKLAKGEISLRVGQNEPFGVLSVGDANALCNLIRDNHPVSFVEDALNDSLFARVNAPDSPVNLLIGAKKFMEGWNSWRVAGMGLLNVGRSEGAEIIQLFGRGVRLRGRDMTLKRSAHLEGEHPEHLKLLETLNIFAVRANFLDNFRLYLEREGVDEIKLSLQTRPNSEFLHEGLFVPKLEGEFGETVVLESNPNIRVTVDFSERLQIIQSAPGGGNGARPKAPAEQSIPEESLDLLDWDDLFTRLIDHKDQRNWSNLLLNRENLREIVEQCVRIRASEDYLRIESFAERQRLQDTAAAALLKYADRLHHAHERRWQAENMKTGRLSAAHGNFQDYSVFVPSGESELAEKLRAAIELANDEYNQQWDNRANDELHNIYFDRHLFQPLLLRRPNGKIRIVPPGLEDSERKFVKNLEEFCLHNSKRFAGLSIFLLRNLPRRGIGFPDEGGDNFYPDFILWVKRNNAQRIVFVEPHGMRQENHPDNNPRVKLHEWLAEISGTLSRRYPNQPKLTFDSYTVSETPQRELEDMWGRDWNTQKFRENHILFSNDADLIQTIIDLPDSS